MKPADKEIWLPALNVMEREFLSANSLASSPNAARTE
jgi:hypothetical protein